MNIISLFSGAGGLDLGFKQANFNIIFANEKDKTIWDTYRFNHKNTFLDTRSITNIKNEELPLCDGIIGGPPCQSWSAGGRGEGINDDRGKLFFEFIRIIKFKKPRFFLAENVKGMLNSKHKDALNEIQNTFQNLGYDLYFKLFNTSDYGVAQDRERVIFIGFRKDLKIKYDFPKVIEKKIFLKNVIKDLENQELPAINKNKPNPDLKISNHEYLVDGFSSQYMSRNRVRAWDQPSFTILASGRQIPIHPSVPPMVKIEQDKRIFAKGYEHKYRRLTVRECARIQGFPDDFNFIYNNINDGYKMVGNAVPVNFARLLAISIRDAMQ